MADQPTQPKIQDQIAKQCRAEYEAGLKFRHDREKAWQLIEDFYFNRVKKTLKGKFNVPVPIIPGFVDTWQAKLSKPVALSFDQGVDADYRAFRRFYVDVFTGPRVIGGEVERGHFGDREVCEKEPVRGRTFALRAFGRS